MQPPPHAAPQVSPADALHHEAHVGPPDAQILLHYIDSPPPASTPQKGVLVLLHGFPQTSHQYRHILPALTTAGYRVLIPDYRGAGHSGKPVHAPFTKTAMADDIFALVTHVLRIAERVHLVGHDIGAMVAHAYASRHAEHVASIVWGECPLPGTRAYERARRSVSHFHFAFHAAAGGDIAEALVRGREREYVGYFFDKLGFNVAAFTEEDVGVYAAAYAGEGALRCAFRTYAALEADARENAEWVAQWGKCAVPALVVSGAESEERVGAEEMGREVYEDVEVVEIKDAGHYIAEEAPGQFVEKILAFVGKYGN